MKRILIAGALALAAGGQALAADLPQPAPQPPRAPATYVPAQAPYFSWTGIYVGINGGYGFGQSNWTAPLGAPTGNFSTSGFLVGGTLGGNYQMGAFVIGLEGDGDWSNANGTSFSSCPAGCTTQSTWLATVRGRAGYAWIVSCSTERAVPLSAMFKLGRELCRSPPQRKLAGRPVPASNGPLRRTGRRRSNTYS